MRQVLVTTAMGKRLIGKGLAANPDIQAVLVQGTLVITAGSTNGYVAEEILGALGQAEGFSRVGFRRGLTVPPGAKAAQVPFPGDVVIVDGEWQHDKVIGDVADDLREGDIVLKGANAFDPYGKAAVQIGHPKGGTALAAVPAVIGRRVRLIVPVGLEKRVMEDVHVLAQICNAPGVQGPRLYPLPGEIYTELDAIEELTGAEAVLLAAGGVYGAEGAYWLGIVGEEEYVEAARELIRSISDEPPCEV